MLYFTSVAHLKMTVTFIKAATASQLLYRAL